MVGDFEKIDHALGQILADLRLVRSSQDRVEEWFEHQAYERRGSAEDLSNVQCVEPSTAISYGESEYGEFMVHDGTLKSGCTMIHHGTLKSTHSSANTQDDPLAGDFSAIFPNTTSMLPALPCHPLQSLSTAFADDRGAKYLKPRNNTSVEDGLYERRGTRASSGSKRFSSMHKQKLASNCFEQIVYHRYFEPASAFLIVFHASFIACYVESIAVHKGDPPALWAVCNQVLVGVFFVEVVLKMFAERLEYFCGSDILWNVFDLILVIMVMIELFVTIVTSSLDKHRRVVKKMLKMGEVLRTLRLLRIFRVLRFSHSLSTVISKIFSSIKTIFWVMVLIVMLIFVVAVCFTTGATHYLDDSEAGDAHEVITNFGSVSRSFMTVFKSVSGGMRWGQAADSLQAMSVFYFSLFLVYIAFTMFAGLNIITGIFVDAALQTAATERDLIMERQHELERVSVDHLREVFFDMDAEDNGILMMDQFKKSFTDERVKAFMHSLKINTSDATQLFRLLDCDNRGEILIDEFVEGCMKLRGEAKCMDIHILMCESRRMWAKFAFFSEQLCEYLGELSKTLSDKNPMSVKIHPVAPFMCGSSPGSRKGSNSRRASEQSVLRWPSQIPSRTASEQTVSRWASQPTSSFRGAPPQSTPSLFTVGERDAPEPKELPGLAQPEVETKELLRSQSALSLLTVGSKVAPVSKELHRSAQAEVETTGMSKPPHPPKTIPVPSIHPFGSQLDSNAR